MIKFKTKPECNLEAGSSTSLSCGQHRITPECRSHLITKIDDTIYHITPNMLHFIFIFPFINMIFVIIACRINPRLSIFWFALWSIAICISSSQIHEIGHATAAKRCSRNIHTLIGFWHTKFVGIEHVDSKHKKLITLAGATFGEIYVLFFMFLI